MNNILFQFLKFIGLAKKTHAYSQHIVDWHNRPRPKIQQGFKGRVEERQFQFPPSDRTLDRILRINEHLGRPRFEE